MNIRLFNHHRRILKLSGLFPLACAGFILYGWIGHLKSDTVDLNPVPGPPEHRLDDQCQCRHILAPAIHENVTTTCGNLARARGGNQRILSFVIYGHLEDDFLLGIQRNFDLMNEFFPESYAMRVYHNFKASPEDMRRICKPFCANQRIDLCDVGKLGNVSESFGMLWRFLPMADDLVSEWHSRDLDSRLSQRELAAIEDWLQVGTHYHLMRDNRFHSTYIMGGMFGMRLTASNRLEMRESLEEMLKAGNGKVAKGVDQTILAQLLFKKMSPDATIHDSYLCKHFPHPGNRPFPTQRLMNDDVTKELKWNFVGSNGQVNNLH